MSSRMDSYYRDYDRERDRRSPRSHDRERRRSRSRSGERRRHDRDASTRDRERDRYDSRDRNRERDRDRDADRDRRNSYRSNGSRRSHSKDRERGASETSEFARFAREREHIDRLGLAPPPKPTPTKARSRSPPAKMSRPSDEYGNGLNGIGAVGQRESTGIQVKDGFVFTPFGAFRVQPPPNPKEFIFEPASGYFFDNKTGFYMDPNSGYYFDTNTKEWNFWSALYNTYIPCEGGNIDWKKSLQILEKEDDFLKMARSKSPTTMVKIFDQFKEYITGNEGGDHTYTAFSRHQEEKEAPKQASPEPPRREKTPEKPWKCHKCDTENGAVRKNCFKCGTKKETIEEFEARGAHLIGVDPTDTLLVRDFPKGVDEDKFQAWVRDFAGSISKRFHIPESKKYYLIETASVDKSKKFLEEFNNAAKMTNISVKMHFSKIPLSELMPEKRFPSPAPATAPAPAATWSSSLAASQIRLAPDTNLPPRSTQPVVPAVPERKLPPAHASSTWSTKPPTGATWANTKSTTISTPPVVPSPTPVQQAASAPGLTPMVPVQSIAPKPNKNALEIANRAARAAANGFQPFVTVATPDIMSSTNTQKLVEVTCEMVVVLHNQKEWLLRNYPEEIVANMLTYFKVKIETLLNDLTDTASREKDMAKFAAHPDLVDKAAVIMRTCLEQHETVQKMLFPKMLLDDQVMLQDFAIRIQSVLNKLLHNGTVKKKVESSKSDPRWKPRRDEKSTRGKVEYASSDEESDRSRRDGDPTSKCPLTGEDTFSMQLKKFVEDKKNFKKGVELCFNCARLGHKPAECIYAKAPKAMLEQMRFLYKIWKDEGKPTYQEIVDRYNRSRRGKRNEERFDKSKVELDGRDRLTRQLKDIVPDGRVRRSHLVLCKNCAIIGHTLEECRRPPVENSRVQEMRVLIDLFVKKYRLDDIIVADVRYDEIGRESTRSRYDSDRDRERDREPRNSRSSYERDSRRDPRGSRNSHEDSPLPSAGSLTSASGLPPPLEPMRPAVVQSIKPDANQPKKPEAPKNSSANFTPAWFNLFNNPTQAIATVVHVDPSLPDLTGKDKLSMQLKILAPSGRVTSKILRLCEKCACVGHKMENCTYPQASQEDIRAMKHLINLYQDKYGQVVLANDMYEAQSEKASISREGSQVPVSNEDSNDTARLELDGNDPFSKEVQKIQEQYGRVTKQLLKLCNNCGRLGHAMKDCQNEKADSKFLYNMSHLRNQYLMKNGYSDELSEEERKTLKITGTDPFSRSLKSICSDGIVLKKHLVLCMNCAQLGHDENLCNNSWVGTKKVQEMDTLFQIYKEKWRAENKKNADLYKVTADDPFSRELKNSAPNGVVTLMSLYICTSCAKLGHRNTKCSSPKQRTPELMIELKKMVAYRRQYLKAVKQGQYQPIMKDDQSRERATWQEIDQEIDQVDSDDEK